MSARTWTAATLVILAISSSPARSEPMASSPTVSTLGPNLYSIKECDKSLNLYPYIVYKITLGRHFSMYSASVRKQIRATTINSSGDFDEYVNSPAINNNNNISDWQNKTRIGIRTPLPSITDSVLVKIVLDNKRLSFRSDGFALRAGDPIGEAMFCDLRYDGHSNSLTFKVQYLRGKGGKPLYGTYNIGVNVKDRKRNSKFSLPIFFDPEIKNEG